MNPFSMQSSTFVSLTLLFPRGLPPNKSKTFVFDLTESGKEIFVHVSGLIDEIKENDQVTYDETEGKKGMNAVNVKLI